jgi:hypothetical protein
MDVWTIMAPVMGAHFDDPSGRFAQQVVKIPGIRVRKGKLEVPQNALNCMIETLQQTDGSLRAISWMVEPREPAKWQDVEAKLREVGEVRPFVLDGFLMPYQQEAVEFGWSKDGVHFWHPTGSGQWKVHWSS